MKRRPLLLFSALLLAACFRNEIQEHFFPLPDASPPQLATLRTQLLEEQALLPEDLRHLLLIRVHADPPGLQVRFRARHFASRNLEQTLREKLLALSPPPPPP